MGRKRIIVEVEEDLDLLGQIKSIDEKVTGIQKKQNPPWLLPILLLFLTSTMTYVNYRLQRHYVNEDLYKNKLKEKIAEARAVTTVNFFSKSKELLDTIDVAFESYCRLGASADDDNTLTVGIIRLNSTVRHQLKMDAELQKKLEAYTEFVSEHTLQMDSSGSQHLEAVYDQSTPLYKEAKDQIDRSLTELTQ